MKSITILNKIIKTESCSVNQIKLLDKALHREKLLKEKEALRFRPLYGDFDIINFDYELNGVSKVYMDGLSFADVYAIFS